MRNFGAHNMVKLRSFNLNDRRLRSLRLRCELFAWVTYSQKLSICVFDPSLMLRFDFRSRLLVGLNRTVPANKEVRNHDFLALKRIFATFFESCVFIANCLKQNSVSLNRSNLSPFDFVFCYHRVDVFEETFACDFISAHAGVCDTTGRLGAGQGSSQTLGNGLVVLQNAQSGLVGPDTVQECRRCLVKTEISLV